MYPRRFVPMLLMAGAVMMMLRHRHGFAEECGEREKHAPFSFHGGFFGDSLGGPRSGPHGGLHSEWGKRVPPFFEKWHEAAHAPKPPTPEI